MSLPKIDYKMPITIRVIASHQGLQQRRLTNIDILWMHVLAVEEEAFPEQYGELGNQGVCTIRLPYGSYTAIGKFREYHNAWCEYKAHLINEEKKFHLPLQ